jgi:hypothetical protein
VDFIPDSGDLVLHEFLIVDGNGVAGYQGADLDRRDHRRHRRPSPAKFIG